MPTRAGHSCGTTASPPPERGGRHLRFSFLCVAFLFFSSLPSLSGCRFGGAGFRSERPTGLEMEVEQADRYSRESHTLSNLAVLEKGIEDYLKSERRIPRALDILIPKFLAEIPAVELGMRNHRDNSNVRYYSPEIIENGVINGARLRDSGQWGYVHSDRQVIVFVDCTHLNSRSRPWYKERGVF